MAALAAPPEASSLQEEAAGPSAGPWQSLPAFLAHWIVSHVVFSEPRWGLSIAALRLAASDWQAAVAEALPVLSPRPHVPIDEAAFVAACFPGLRLLRIESPGTAVTLRQDRVREQAAALAAVCAACTALTALHLDSWQHMEEAALEPLSALHKLRSLGIRSNTLRLGPDSLAALGALPRLQRLGVQCRSLACAGLAALSSLTSLDLTATELRDAEAGLAPALLQLRSLRHLGLSGLSAKACSGLAALTALPALTSLALQHQDAVGLEQGRMEPVPVLEAFAAAAGGGAAAGASEEGGGGGPGLRRLRVESYGLALLQIDTLRGVGELESLTLSYANMQLDGATLGKIIWLSRLTELALDLGQLEHENPEENVTRLVAMAGMRLTRLRRLHLHGAQHVEEWALAWMSGLTDLTSLSLTHVHDFGGQALSALQPLSRLRRLSLSDISLTPPALGAVLEESQEEGLLTGLTRLELNDWRMMSNESVAQLAASLPRLRILVHRGWPHLQAPQLRQLLEHGGGGGLQLLQTTWRPAAAPVLDSPPTEAQREARARHEAEAAFCRQWRLRLQHSLPPEGDASNPTSAPLYHFDEEQALAELLAGAPGAAGIEDR